MTSTVPALPSTVARWQSTPDGHSFLQWDEWTLAVVHPAPNGRFTALIFSPLRYKDTGFKSKEAAAE